VGWVYNSQGRTDIQLRWGIFATCVVTIAFLIGLFWDIQGVVIAYAIAQLLLLYPALAIPFKLIQLRVTEFFKQFKSIFLATMGMGAITFIFRFFLSLRTVLRTNELLILMSTVIAGIISYAVLLFMLDKSLYKEILQLIKQIGKSSSPDTIYQGNCN
jgi:PST family polysaccharide transporter